MAKSEKQALQTVAEAKAAVDRVRSQIDVVVAEKTRIEQGRDGIANDQGKFLESFTRSFELDSEIRSLNLLHTRATEELAAAKSREREAVAAERRAEIQAWAGAGPAAYGAVDAARDVLYSAIQPAHPR